MVNILTNEEFLASEGLEGWQVEGGRAVARFETGSFAAGVEFVRAIGTIADDADHHPDVELTYPAVTVSLITHDAGNVLTELDVDVAREISAAAARQGI